MEVVVPRRMRWSRVALIALGCLACQAQPDVGFLEIGQDVGDYANPEFAALADGADVPVGLGAGGLMILVPSVRALGATPGELEQLEITVAVNDLVIATNVAQNSIVAVEIPDGAPIVWNVLVPFEEEICCYACETGVIEARLVDASGRAFRGSLQAQLVRHDVCPDPSICCREYVCPDGLTTQVCEP